MCTVTFVEESSARYHATLIFFLEILRTAEYLLFHALADMTSEDGIVKRPPAGHSPLVVCISQASWPPGSPCILRLYYSFTYRRVSATVYFLFAPKGLQKWLQIYFLVFVAFINLWMICVTISILRLRLIILKTLKTPYTGYFYYLEQNDRNLPFRSRFII